MNTRSDQEMFDLFYETFIIRAKPQCRGDGGCSYKPTNSDQVGCAVGVALAPEDQIKWQDDLGGDFIDRIASDHPEEYEKYFDQTQVKFLVGLQRLHDEALEAGVEHADLAAREFAERHNLEVPE